MGNRSETQQRIIDAAINIFAAQGYHGTTTAQIANEAQVAEGTIFKYYKTKKLLLKAVLEYIVHEVAPSVMKFPFEEVFMTCSKKDPRPIIKQLLAAKIELINKNVRCIKIVANELQYHDDLKEEYLGHLVPSFISLMENAYETGVKKGVFRNINPHTAVRSFISMLAFTVLEKNVLNPNLEVDTEIERILDIYLNGVLEMGENNV